MYDTFEELILNPVAMWLSGNMVLNILFIFTHKLLEKQLETHLRAHIISGFVAIDDLTKTSRVGWTLEELVAQFSLFSSSSDTTFSLGFVKKQVMAFVADWCFLPKNAIKLLYINYI